MAEGAQTVTLVKHGASKGLMKAPFTSQEKPPFLLREDSNKYALEQLSSIIMLEDYEDLGNHSTEVMVVSGLFAVTQVTIPVDFLSVHSTWFSI